tara:strand:+ start:2814 stop:3014 length:201 start_codon:yes stop_codon:yes gene_type:complete
MSTTQLTHIDVLNYGLTQARTVSTIWACCRRNRQLAEQYQHDWSAISAAGVRHLRTVAQARQGVAA